jgi:6-pyruvoyltetrahydropterin/6-carboxytetrahydropterin synthase
MHGHNWKLEVEVEAAALDDLGMAVDFKVVKEAARDLAGKLDHRYLNEIEPFDQVNPTAENLAAYLYRGLSEVLNNGRTEVHAVTLWETDRASVRYTEGNTP